MNMVSERGGLMKKCKVCRGEGILLASEDVFIDCDYCGGSGENEEICDR